MKWTINNSRKRYHIAIISLTAAVYVLTGCSEGVSYSGSDAKSDKFLDQGSLDSNHNTNINNGLSISDNISDIKRIKRYDNNTYSDKLSVNKIEVDNCAANKATVSDNSVSLIMVGDVLLHDSVNRNCMTPEGTYDYSHIFENTKKEISDADIALVGQEVIIGGEELGVTGYPSFNAPFEIGRELARTGFDVVCQANNHALDRKKAGIEKCLDFWRTEYPEMAVIGIYDDEISSENILIYEKNGIRIAILNYTYGTNGVEMPKDMPYAVNILKEQEVIDDIERAERDADFTVVCPHWGTEYNLDISTDQDKWTDLFCQYGVDLVIGTHPHVIEPIQWIGEEGADRRMLVYYSLGNYVNWTSGAGEGISTRMVGGMASINLVKGEDGKVTIGDYGVEALVCHLSKEKGGISVYRLADYNDDLADTNEIKNQDPDFSRQYCVDLCDRIWGNIWN